MKVLLVNGSPVPNGVIFRALMELSSTIQKEGIESEIFQLGRLPVGGCLDCGYCRKEGKCIQNDRVNEFALLAAKADGFVFGSPVYYAGVAGQLKCFLDRLFYSQSRYLRGKPGAAVVSCRRAGGVQTYDAINKYFGISSMPIVTSTYWNEIHGNNAEEAEKDEEGLQTMRNLAHNMAYLLKCRAAGEKAGVPALVTEKGARTNFIR
jgi:multimeric flavodoxin WrbA